jgi:hypothetical protein
MLSYYLANKLLDHCMGIASFPMPTQVYLAAFSTAPTFEDVGIEASFQSYQRVALQPAQVQPAVAGSSVSAAEIRFPASQGPGDQLITHLATFDQPFGGNMLEFFPLRRAVLVRPGTHLVINPGEFIRGVTVEEADAATIALIFTQPENSQFLPLLWRRAKF